MTLLELVLAMTVMSVMVTAVTVVMRTGYSAWKAQSDDMAVTTEVNAMLRHVVRRVRQAEAVTAISKPSNIEGNLSLQMPTGNTFVWEHEKQSGETRFGVGTADSLLCRGVSKLIITGYEADGVTTTDVPGDVQSVKVEAHYDLPRQTHGARVLSCRAWLRSW